MTIELGIRATLDLPYGQAIQRVTAALKAEGFGVLTEIDVQATLRQKLKADFRRYVILGACNPPLAHRALSANLEVGLLLPCNVIVYEDEEGTAVSAINPMTMSALIQDDPALGAIAAEAQQKLARAIASLKR